ncbi:MAG: hypothetical protein P8X74_18985 [Reinekea sp.]
MDRIYCNPDNTDHYCYSQIHQEDGQYISQPETGQTSGTAASGPLWSHPAPDQPQPYQSFDLPAQIPLSPSPNLEYFLNLPQPMTFEDIILSQIYQEDGQHTSQPEAGQTSAEGPASGPSWSHPTLGRPQPYHGFNLPAQIPLWSRPDGGASQPTTVADISQHDALPGSSSSQPAAPSRRRKPRVKGLPPVKERFLAGLEAFGRGVLLKDCSLSIRFSNYIKSDGRLTNLGPGLYDQLTEAEKTRLEQAIIARRGTKLIKRTIKTRFLEGLDNYAQGVQLKDCSVTLQFKHYATDNGHLHKAGQDVCKGLSPKDLARVNQALLCRRESYLKRAMANPTVAERFLAGLDNYAQGVQLKDCSETIQFNDYVTDDGRLHPLGQNLRNNLPLEDQARLNQALLCRRESYSNRTMANPSVEKRFLASLDNYARGLLLGECAENIKLRIYVSDDGRLQQGRGQGQSLYHSLSWDDKMRVDQALTARRKIYAQRIAKDVDNFMATLEPYANGLSLQECGKKSGLKKKAIAYLTPEGGLTYKGQRLIENLQPGQLNKVLEAIGKRQQHRELNPQVPEPEWQWPENLSSMMELGGMDLDPAAMVDPIQAETMYYPMQMESMQTETMWASVWQLTGQAVPGPSGSAESSIPYYGSETVGTDFRHQYGPHGLMPQSAPDRLIGRGILNHMLINIQGEVYRVQDMGSSSVGSTNENPYGKSFMLVPRMRGG